MMPIVSPYIIIIIADLPIVKIAQVMFFLTSSTWWDGKPYKWVGTKHQWSKNRDGSGEHSSPVAPVARAKPTEEESNKE